VTVKKEGPLVEHSCHTFSTLMIFVKEKFGNYGQFFECVKVKADKKIKTIAVGKILYEAPDGQQKHKILQAGESLFYELKYSKIFGSFQFPRVSYRGIGRPVTY